MGKQFNTHQDGTDATNEIVDTGDAQKNRKADKRGVGQKEADKSVSKGKDPEVFPSGKVHEQFAELFADVEGLSEDFAEKATTIIEGAISEHVSNIRESLEADYAKALEEELEKLDEKLEGYMTLAVENFINDNKVAMVESIQVDFVKDVMASVVGIVESAGVEIPADKVDVVANLQTENEDLQKKLNESAEEVLELRKVAENYKRAEVFAEHTADLSEAGRDKLRKLTENIAFIDNEKFAEKLVTLKEGIETAKAEVGSLNEAVIESKPSTSTPMDMYVKYAVGTGK